jgi:hypothetical protein
MQPLKQLLGFTKGMKRIFFDYRGDIGGGRGAQPCAAVYYQICD